MPRALTLILHCPMSTSIQRTVHNVVYSALKDKFPPELINSILNYTTCGRRRRSYGIPQGHENEDDSFWQARLGLLKSEPDQSESITSGDESEEDDDASGDESEFEEDDHVPDDLESRPLMHQLWSSTGPWVFKNSDELHQTCSSTGSMGIKDDPNSYRRRIIQLNGYDYENDLTKGKVTLGHRGYSSCGCSRGNPWGFSCKHPIDIPYEKLNVCAIAVLVEVEKFGLQEASTQNLEF